MSKIGKLPVEIKSGVTVTVADHTVSVSGPKGSLSFSIPSGVIVTVAGNTVQTSQEKGFEESTKSLFGLTRATIANYIIGVSTGFEKKLELIGVGYRAHATPNELTLSLGFSHPVKVNAIQGITFAVVDNVISISGCDPVLVGNVAAHIRAIKPPEPYKGKGIKFFGEKIRRKPGKAAKAVGGSAGGGTK